MDKIKEANKCLDSGLAQRTVAVRTGLKLHQVQYLTRKRKGVSKISEKEYDLDEIRKYHSLGYKNNEIISVLHLSHVGLARALTKLGLTKN